MNNKITKEEKFRACKKEIESYHVCIQKMAANHLYDDLCETHLSIIQSCMKRVESQYNNNDNNSNNNQFVKK